jgi:hypothetical protein
MSFGILNFDYMPRFRTFQDVEEFYHCTSPIRGKTREEYGVPLHSERRQSDIKALHQLTPDSYSLRLYDTDVLVLHRNGDLEINVSYGSMSTDAWADGFLATLVGDGAYYYQYKVSVRSEHDLIWVSPDILHQDQVDQWKHETAESDRTGNIALFTDEDKFYLRNINGKFYVDNAAPRYQKLVKRTGAAELRKPLQPFIKYLKVFESMPLTDEARDELKSGCMPSIIEDVVRNPDNQELWGKAAAYLHESNYRGYYDANNQWRYGYETALRPIKAIKTELYKLAYALAGANKFVQLPFGTCKNAQLYTQDYVERF